MRKLIAWSVPVIAFVPMVAFAQFGEAGNFLEEIIRFINNTLVPLVFAIAFIVFLFGIFQFFILGAGDEGKRETGKQYMLYGIVGFVVMVSVWGIVNLLANSLGLTDERLQNIPDAPTQND